MDKTSIAKRMSPFTSADLSPRKVIGYTGANLKINEDV